MPSLKAEGGKKGQVSDKPKGLPSLLFKTVSVSQSTMIGIIVCVQLVFLSFQFCPYLCSPLESTQDHIVSESLVRGKGYRLISQPQEPLASGLPAVFPALLTLPHLVSDSPLVSKVIVALMGIGVILLCFLLFRKDFPHLILPLMLCISFSDILSNYSLVINGEVCFLLFSLLAMLLLRKSHQNTAHTPLFWTATIVSVIAASSSRIGIAFSLFWVATNLATKHYRYAVIHLGLFLITTGLLHGSLYFAPPYFTQIMWRNTYDPGQGCITMAELFHRILINGALFGRCLSEGTLFPLLSLAKPFFKIILSTLLAVAVLAGLVRSFFLPSRPVSLYAVIFSAWFLVQPVSWASVRSFVGVLPFIYFFALLGLTFICESVLLRARSAGDFVRHLQERTVGPLNKRTIVVLWGFVYCVLLANVTFRASQLAVENSQKKEWMNFYSCADWVRTHAPSEAVVLTVYPEYFFIRSHHKSVAFPSSSSIAYLIETIQTAKVSYVISDDFSWTQMSSRLVCPAVTSHGNLFKEVFGVTNPEFSVLEYTGKWP
jgi:hypothetical protein